MCSTCSFDIAFDIAFDVAFDKYLGKKLKETWKGKDLIHNP